MLLGMEGYKNMIKYFSFATAAAQVCGTLRQLVAKSRQIGATGAAGYYGFTTSERLKIGECKIMVREMKNGIFRTFVLFR